MAVLRNPLRRAPVLIVLCLAGTLAHAQYGGGTGEPNDPYLIYTAEQMNAMGTEPNDWGKCFKLMADIDLSAYDGREGRPGFTIIGRSDNCQPVRGGEPCYTSFSGVFDGNGRNILNFNYVAEDGNDIGLFGQVSGGDAEIRNLCLIDPNVTVRRGRNVGTLVGNLAFGKVVNCCVRGAHVSGDEAVGGLAGCTGGWLEIADCYVKAEVTGHVDVGGLVGHNSTGIQSCHTEGMVLGQERVGGLVGGNGAGITHSYSTAGIVGRDGVGGLVGRNELWSGRVRESYAAGDVNGVTDVGGLVGDNGVEVTDCYAVGSVSGSEGVGGLVGCNRGRVTNGYSIGRSAGKGTTGGLVGCGYGHVVNSFWNTETSGQTASAGGTGKTTSQMQQATTYGLWGACDHAGIWTQAEGQDYPRLAWEGHAGQALGLSDLTGLLSGRGTAGDPFLITTAEDLYAIGFFPCDWDKSFRLMADIDLSGFDGKEGRPTFKTIATSGADQVSGSFSGVPFTGVFDGNGHSITNFTHAPSEGSHFGFFGHVEKGQIRNVGMINPRVTGDSLTAVLVAHLVHGSVVNCYVSGGTVTGDNQVALLVGEVHGGTVTDCDVSGGAVTGTYEVGALAGLANGGRITRCHSTARVGGYDCVGGMVGNNGSDISDCESSGAVTGDEEVGGVAGYNWGRISGSCSRSIVKGKTYVGGITGQNYAFLSDSEWSAGSGIADCYFVGSVTGVESVGGLVGRNGLKASSAEYLGIVSRSYCAGKVSGTRRVGGLVGLQEAGTTEDSFWDIQFCGPMVSAGGTGRSTALMRTAGTFTAAGWDLAGEIPNGLHETWRIPPEGGYPVLTALNGDTPPQLLGQGTRAYPYLISTPAELGAVMHYDPNACYRLTTSIDVSGICWKKAIIPEFAGSFDGAGYTIAHLTCTGDASLGLFGWLQTGAEVKDLGVVDVNITYPHGNGAGGLARFNEGSVTRCYTTGLINVPFRAAGLVAYNGGSVTSCHSAAAISAYRWAGGLAAHNYGSISNSSSSGAVAADYCAGGLVGDACEGTISACYSTGSVSGNDAGGLAGENYHGTLSNCYSTGSVRGDDGTGGLVGQNFGAISFCYSTGSVRGSKDVAGLLGQNYGGTISACFWDFETSGQPASAGGTGLATAKMQSILTFLDAGWDFVGETANGTADLWWIDEGKDYPRLSWETRN